METEVVKVLRALPGESERDVWQPDLIEVEVWLSVEEWAALARERALEDVTAEVEGCSPEEARDLARQALALPW